jgi:hypothetical protein
MAAQSLHICYRGQSGKHLLAASILPFDLSPTSPLGHPGHTHAFKDAPASGEEGRIVALGAITAESKTWIER